MTTAHAHVARPIDLALQGGGSHGAFTWGVLDGLLEDGRLLPDGVSGTSAGAMNAAVLATGYARGGRDGARAALKAFWHAVSDQNPAPAPAMTAWGVAWPDWLFNRSAWPGYNAMEAWTRLLSPAQLNPLGLDPLRDIVKAHVDVAAIRQGPIKVFVTATSVRTGQPRVFSGDQLSVDALMASACLPQTSRSVVIDGEAYWDGGFAGNPSLWPLIYNTDSRDLLLIQINPLVRQEVPTSAVDIQDRMNEITFNASLVAEMRAIAFVQRLVKEKRVDLNDYKALRLHRIADEASLARFGASSKLNNDLRLLTTLFDIGRHAAQAWLAQHADAVGHQGTLDAAKVYLGQGTDVNAAP